MWVRSFFYLFFIFSFFLVPFNCLAESVDRWTSSEHSEKKINPIYVLFKSVDLQTKSCLSIFCFFLALHPSKSCQKVWTQAMKMLKMCLFVLGFQSLRCYFAWPRYWYLGKSQLSQAPLVVYIKGPRLASVWRLWNILSASKSCPCAFGGHSNIGLWRYE